MKKQDKKSLHEQTVSELTTQLQKMEAELGKSRVEHAVNKLSNTASLKVLRKSIARIRTILREKELNV